MSQYIHTIFTSHWWISHRTQLCDSQSFRDSRTIMKSFLNKIAREFTRNLHKNRTKFPENLRAISLRNDFAPQKSCEKNL